MQTYVFWHKVNKTLDFVNIFSGKGKVGKQPFLSLVSKLYLKIQLFYPNPTYPPLFVKCQKCWNLFSIDGPLAMFIFIKWLFKCLTWFIDLYWQVRSDCGHYDFIGCSKMFVELTLSNINLSCFHFHYNSWYCYCQI